MDFTVRASIKYDDLHPQKVKLFGTGSIEDASELLLDAVHDVQQRAGVPSTREYVSEAARAFKNLEQLLDNVGVQCGASMPGLLDGVASLAQEVKELRTACTTSPPHMHSGQLLELAEQRNLAQAEARRLRRELASVTDTLREVRTSLNVAPEAHDGDLVEIARDVRGWADAWLELTPQRLAEEIHNGRSAAGIDVGISWRNLSETMQGKSVRAAEYALGRLTDVARPSAPATPGQVARLLFEASRRVAEERGTEPIPLVDTKTWEAASSGRRDWWGRVAHEVLANVGISVPTALLPVTAAELAEAIHAAVMEHANPDGDVVDEAFEDASPEWNAWRLRVSQSTLDRLPSIAAPKREFPPVSPLQLAKAMHAARCAASTASAEGKGLRAPLWIGVPWEQLHESATDWFEHVADVALLELSQLVRGDAGADAQFGAQVNEVISKYQVMVSTLAEQRDRAQAEARRHKDMVVRLQAAWNTVAEKLGMSFGRAFDDVVVAPMIVEAIGQLKAQHGRDLDGLRRSVRAAEEQSGVLQGMVRGIADQMELDIPEGGLFKPGPFGEALRAWLAQRPVVAPEDLARAWMETPSGGQGFPWVQAHPDVQREFVEHARKVLHFLSLQNMVTGKLDQARVDWERFARSGGEPDVLLGVPGTFFTVDETGETLRGKAFLVEDGNTVSKSPQVGALLEQVRELSAEMRSLREAHANRVSLFGRLAEVIGVDGASDREIVESIVATYADFNARIPALAREVRDLRSEQSDHYQDLRMALGIEDSLSWEDLISNVVVRVRDSDDADGLRRRQRDTETGCRVAARLPQGTSHADVMVFLNETVTALVDIRHRLMLEPDASVVQVLKAVAKLVKRAEGAGSLAQNALTAINELLGLNEKQFPAGTVDAVRGLRESWGVMEEWLPRLFDALGVDVYVLSGKENVAQAMGRALDCARELKVSAGTNLGERAFVKRVTDSAYAVLEAAGIDTVTDSPDAVVQKAGDAAAILRSWPDVLRAVNAFQGEDIEQPDEVAPNLETYAKMWSDPPKLFMALERLLAAHRGEPLRNDVGTMHERVDNLVKRLFAVVEETGRMHGIRYTLGESKVTFADMVLMNIRNHVAMAPSELAGHDHVGPVVNATKAAEFAGLVKSIKVFDQTQMWVQGPTASDADPEKRWHVGCGGEVKFLGNVGVTDVCVACRAVCVPQEGSAAITVTESPSPFVDGGLDVEKAIELVEGDES